MNLFEPYQPHAPERESESPVPDLIIRQATKNDILLIAGLQAERSGGSINDQATAIQRELEDRSEQNQLFIAESGDRSIGYARCSYFAAREELTDGFCSPAGWYLTGIIVDRNFRRRGVATALTEKRLHWLHGKTDRVFSFCNALNLVSIELHTKCGFIEIRRGPSFQGVTFTGGTGILFIRSVGSQ